MRSIYLDNAATTALDPAVRAAMEPWLVAEFGNPSARHPMGVRAAEALESARGRLARVAGGGRCRIVFTSGGTEANNLAVLGIAGRAAHPGRLVLGPSEHPSVREAAAALGRRGWSVAQGRLDARGDLDLDHVESLLDERTAVVAQMLVSNEHGSVYPVAELARRVRRRAPGAHFHVDAVQALGRLDVALEELGADSIALSAHKVHGPKGVGALVAREGFQAEPLVFGGGQEGGLRSGTENVAGIVGFAEAAALADRAVEVRSRADLELRAALAEGLARVPGARLLAPGSARVGSICAMLVPPPAAEVWLHHLEARGVHASAGAACQARKGTLSPGLVALGLSEDEVRRVLRFSFARTTTRGDVEAAVDALSACAAELAGVRS